MKFKIQLPSEIIRIMKYANYNPFSIVSYRVKEINIDRLLTVFIFVVK
jgi:hypothetical protein